MKILGYKKENKIKSGPQFFGKHRILTISKSFRIYQLAKVIRLELSSVLFDAEILK